MALDLSSQTGIEALAALWMAAARSNLEKTGKLPPVASVICTDVSSGSSFIPADDPITPESNAKWVASIREAARNGAIAVITAGEAVVWDEESKQEIDAVVVDLEHAAFGNHSWIANVIRSDSGVRLTPFQKRPASNRFGGYLKK